MTMNSIFRLVGIGLVAALSAHQAQAKVGRICLDLPQSQTTLSAKIHSGCLPTSPNYRGEFTVETVPERAMIVINGAFEPLSDFHIGTADCMGARVLDYSAEDVAPRRYSVMINGEYAGVFDASAGLGQSGCYSSPRAGFRQGAGGAADVKLLRRSDFEDWQAATPYQIEGLSARSIGQVIAALMGNHPDSSEGRANVAISLTKGIWDWRRPGLRRDRRPFYALRIDEHGFADDSISGQRRFAELRLQEDGTWRVAALWRQYMCARGERAGQWSGQPCA